MLILLIAACSTPERRTPKKESTPNIVLIVADDLGYPYAGFMGDTLVQTPHLDRLTSMGTVFTSGMVTESHCAPSLRTIITGLHCETFDLKQEQLRELYRDSLTASLSSEDSMIWEREFQWKSMSFFKTLPHYLSDKGYKSFQGGKWWEFNYQNGGFTHGMSTVWTKEDRKQPNFFYKLMGNDGLKLGRVTDQPVYDFLEEAGTDPFFIWYAPDLPHYPLNAPTTTISFTPMKTSPNQPSDTMPMLPGSMKKWVKLWIILNRKD
ncbi:MAG: sulfatase-like hydrolase/transferase [Cytophagales bacterium]|nr:sulfatase-like hydrolase/transferase [Cytophagales bacterium]